MEGQVYTKRVKMALPTFHLLKADFSITIYSCQTQPNTHRLLSFLQPRTSLPILHFMYPNLYLHFPTYKILLLRKQKVTNLTKA